MLRHRVLLVAAALAVVVGGATATVRFTDRWSSATSVGTYKRCPPPALTPKPSPTTRRQTRPSVSTRFVLPTHVVTDGCTLTATVIVENGSGHVLHGVRCGPVFAVGLENHTVKQDMVFAACAVPYSIPVGESTYPATINAFYQECDNSPDPARGSVTCDAGGRPPALPEGTYRLRLYGAEDLVPRPASVNVKVR